MSLATILVDDTDGYIETNAWVEVIDGETDTEEKALACLEAEFPIPDLPAGNVAWYLVTGRVHQKLSGYAVLGDDDVRSERPLTDYGDPCSDCEGRGRYLDEDCEGCRGTGVEVVWIYRDEFQPWETCDAGDPEARPFWIVEQLDGVGEGR